MLGLAPLAAFAVALSVSALLLLPAARRIALDVPNERSLHARPVPRTGGLAIAAGVAAGCALAPSAAGAVFVLASGLAMVSFVDDVSGLPTALRLGVHVAAAAAVLALGPPVGGPIAFALLLLAIAWLTNAFNFMDGADGLAAGMGFIGFGSYALAAAHAGSAPLAAACGSIAAACGGFLAFNWHPARLFMGDVGSVPLGFLAGALGVWGWTAGDWPLWFPALVFAPFLGDASLTLLRRLWRRERVWLAHREHYYQRLVLMGFGHRRTAVSGYALMAACAAIAFAILQQPLIIQAFALAWAIAALLGVATWIDVRWKARA